MRSRPSSMESSRWLHEQQEIFGDLDPTTADPLGLPPEIGPPQTARRQARRRIAMTDRGPNKRASGGSPVGIIVTLLLGVAVAGLGAWLYMRNGETTTTAPTGNAPATQQTGEAPAPIEPVTGSPVLDQPATYVPKNNIVEIDLSEYAGYGGLIVANGGLAPNPDSFFAKQYGFKVKISVSRGARPGARSTTATSPPRPRRPTRWPCSAASSTSPCPCRSVIRAAPTWSSSISGIASVNQLAGKVARGARSSTRASSSCATSRRKPGVPVKVLRDLDAKPAAARGRAWCSTKTPSPPATPIAYELTGSQPRLNGCVGWTPKTDEVIEASKRRRQGAGVEPQPAGHRRRAGGQQGLRQGTSGNGEGPRCTASSKATAGCSDSQTENIGVVAQGLQAGPRPRRATSSRTCICPTCRRTARSSPAPSTPPARSGGIFQSSVLAYGSLIRNPVDAERFIEH